MITYTLDNAEDIARDSPASFYIPPRAEREKVEVKKLVKLIFRMETETEAFVERMWVIVKEKTETGGFIGVLDNDPYCTEEIKAGIEISFGPENIIAID